MSTHFLDFWQRFFFASNYNETMKVTKYPQSCLILEKNGRRIAIDVGSVALAEYKFTEMCEGIEAVLYTHKHYDHYESSIVDELKRLGVQLYGNAEVAGLIGKGAHLVNDGDSFEVAGFAVTPYDLEHFKHPDGSQEPHNTGYLIDNHFFVPGDGLYLDGLKADVMAVTIGTPAIDFNQNLRFVEAAGAKKAIPVHYDVFKADPQDFKKAAVGKGFEVIVLQSGESVSL